MRRLPLLTAATAAAVLLPAAVSSASTISAEGNTIVYRASQPTSLLVAEYDGQVGLGDESAQIQTGLCHLDALYGIPLCAAGHPLKIYGSAGRDRLQIAFDMPDSLVAEIHGGDGNDEVLDASGGDAGRKLYGDGGNDTVQGYGGDDVIDGGDGNDEVDGGAGNDQVHGGNGNDTMWGDHYADPGADLIDGGPGYDNIADWSIPSDLENQPGVDVTLDGVANDGRPGEGDNVVGVEKFQMYVVGRLVGSDTAEDMNIYNPGNVGPSTLIGNGGDDRLIGNDFDDSVDGGAGNDHVEGGMGNDTVIGGPGKDEIYGDATSAYCTWYSCKVPFGNDTIYAADGEADQIDCGIGEDTVYADAIDTVTNCEMIDGAGPGVGDQPGGGDGPGGGGGAAALSFSLGKVRLAALRSRGLKLSVPCASACTVSGTITLKGRKIGSGRGTALKAGTAKATLRLTKAGKQRLKRLRTAKLTIKVVRTSADGAKATGRRIVTVKR
jgi:hypothetical protein